MDINFQIINLFYFERYVREDKMGFIITHLKIYILIGITFVVPIILIGIILESNWLFIIAIFVYFIIYMEIIMTKFEYVFRFIDS